MQRAIQDKECSGLACAELQTEVECYEDVSPVRKYKLLRKDLGQALSRTLRLSQRHNKLLCMNAQDFTPTTTPKVPRPPILSPSRRGVVEPL